MPDSRDSTELFAWSNNGKSTARPDERKAVWKASIELHRCAGRITDAASYVALALLKRLGQDGRCDPSHQALADDSGV